MYEVNDDVAAVCEFNHLLFDNETVDEDEVDEMADRLNSIGISVQRIRELMLNACEHNRKLIPTLVPIINKYYSYDEDIELFEDWKRDRLTTVELIKARLKPYAPTEQKIIEYYTAELEFFECPLHLPNMSSDVYDALVSIGINIVQILFTVNVNLLVHSITDAEKFIDNDDVDGLVELAKIHNVKPIDMLCVEPYTDQASYLMIPAIDYAAFVGAVNCFKFLLFGGAMITTQTQVYAVLSENTELLDICFEHSEHSDNMVSFLPKSFQRKRNKTIVEYMLTHRWYTSNKALELFDDFMSMCYFDLIIDLYDVFCKAIGIKPYIIANHDDLLSPDYPVLTKDMILMFDVIYYLLGITPGKKYSKQLLFLGSGGAVTTQELEMMRKLAWRAMIKRMHIMRATDMSANERYLASMVNVNGGC